MMLNHLTRGNPPRPIPHKVWASVGLAEWGFISSMRSWRRWITRAKMDVIT